MPFPNTARLDELEHRLQAKQVRFGMREQPSRDDYVPIMIDNA